MSVFFIVVVHKIGENYRRRNGNNSNFLKLENTLSHLITVFVKTRNLKFCQIIVSQINYFSENI